MSHERLLRLCRNTCCYIFKIFYKRSPYLSRFLL
nr:MAG TPA: hypothetical protein [Crassvirales sp.]